MTSNSNDEKIRYLQQRTNANPGDNKNNYVQQKKKRPEIKQLAKNNS